MLFYKGRGCEFYPRREEGDGSRRKDTTTTNTRGGARRDDEVEERTRGWLRRQGSVWPMYQLKGIT